MELIIKCVIDECHLFSILVYQPGKFAGWLTCPGKILLVFYKFQIDSKWSECRELISLWVSILLWTSTQFFSCHRRLDGCEYGSLPTFAGHFRPFCLAVIVNTQLQILQKPLIMNLKKIKLKSNLCVGTCLCTTIFFSVIHHIMTFQYDSKHFSKKSTELSCLCIK